MCLLIAIIIYFLFILFLSTLLYPMPVNDSGITRYRTIPWTTLILILINTVIFVAWIGPDMYTQEAGASGTVEYGPSPDYMGKINYYGFRETTLHEGIGVAAFTTFTAMFMHADIWHLFGNMMYLWTFGRRVEDACGSSRFLLFYLLSGVIANVGSVVVTPKLDDIPSIGASGAIAGVMGAYLFLFPGTSVNCLWGIGSLIRLPIAVVQLVTSQQAKFWRWTVSVPAWMLLIWFVISSFIPSVETIRSDQDTVGVNHLAHLAGFFAALTIFLFVRKDLFLRYLQGRSL
ncbi:MAG: rhomboid family intramembrane serine protease [Chloroflexi bacterium]|nr:rhomboid family intramembrane serine protease [Chloroflexota bacterium]